MSQRIIKFRAAYANPDGVRWAYGLLSYVQPDYIQIIAVDDATGTSVYNCIPETLGQFTGLKDRNGREIFEGDVIEFDAREWGNADPKDRRWEVTWDAAEGAWSLGGGGTHNADWCYREVIGNIHENPTLVQS